MALDDATAMEQALEKEGYTAQVEYNAMMSEFTGEAIKNDEDSESQKGDVETDKAEEGKKESATGKETETNGTDGADAADREATDTATEKSKDESRAKVSTEGKSPSQKKAPTDKGDTSENESDPITQLQTSINARVRKAEGKLGEVNMRLQELNDAIKDGASDSKAKAKLAELDKVIEKYRSDDPEGHAAMAANASKAVEELRKDLDQRGFVSQEVFKQELEKATFAIEQKLTLDMAHKGWKDTINTVHFNNWVKKQSDDVQSLVESPYAADAISLLDQYEAQKKEVDAETEKEAKEAEKAAKKKQLDDAVPPTTGREKSSKRTTTEFEAMMAEFNS